MDRLINRRQWLRGVLGMAMAVPFTGMLGYPRQAHAAVAGASGLRYDGAGNFKEPERKLPVVREADVIVCGGGPAGFAAAISAARNGAKTVLIEQYGFLGGTWTAGIMARLLDYKKKTGIMRELVERVETTGAQYSAWMADPEILKIVTEEMCLEAGVDLRLHTRVCEAYGNGNHDIELVVTEGLSGREAWRGRVFIDCTGNGDLAAYAGCGFDVGHPEGGKTQPGSMLAFVTGCDEEALVTAGYMEPEGASSVRCKQNFSRAVQEAGVPELSYTMAALYAVRPGLMMMMANHQYDIRIDDADGMTRHAIEGRREVHKIVDSLRRTGGVWRDFRIVATSAHLGIREGRRVRGLYTLTADDLLNGARFDDAVCRSNFPIDVHALGRNNKEKGGYVGHGKKAQPYDIPLRSLISSDVGNLLMAGRNISGDFYAHASYRVTGNAVPMGEAAGKLAAVAVAKNIEPREVDHKLVVKPLPEEP